MKRFRVAAAALVMMLATGMQPLPELTFSRTYTATMTIGALRFDVDQDRLSVTQIVCDKTKPQPSQPVVPVGMQGSNVVVYSTEGGCSDPEVTIGTIDDLHQLMHNLQIVDQQWQQERRREALFDNQR